LPKGKTGGPDGIRSPRPDPQCELNRLKYGCERCCGAGEQNKTAVPFIGMYGLNGLGTLVPQTAPATRPLPADAGSGGLTGYEVPVRT